MEFMPSCVIYVHILLYNRIRNDPEQKAKARAVLAAAVRSYTDGFDATAKSLLESAQIQTCATCQKCLSDIQIFLNQCCDEIPRKIEDGQMSTADFVKHWKDMQMNWRIFYACDHQH